MNQTHVIKDSRASRLISRWLSLGFAAIFCTVALIACGGGNSVQAAVTWTQAEFNTALDAATPFTNLIKQVTGNTSDIADVKTAEARDASNIQLVAVFGHSPGQATTQAVHTDAFHPGGTGAFTASINFGPCPNMGQHIQDGGASDPEAGTLAEFRQCPINGAQYFYDVVDDGTGNISTANTVWFDGANCTGNMIEFQNQVYSRAKLASGIVFNNPADGSEVMVAAGQTATNMTSVSSFAFGSCGPDALTQLGFAVTANDLNVTGVPAAVDPHFVY